MEQKKLLSFNSRRKSFSYAFNGLRLIFKNEPNVKIHTLATIAAIICGVAQQITAMQWIAITFAIGLVWITEALNTCVERLCDLSSENKWLPEIKVIKDIAAAAVLIAAIVSITIAVIIFIF